MKKAIFALLCVGMTMMSFAQDVIHKVNRTTIQADVLEVLEDKIKYKEYKHLDGPVYYINKDDVLKIVYENGKVEEYNPTALFSMDEDEDGIKFEKHILAFDLWEVFDKSLGLSYEYINVDGTIGFRIPLVMGLRETEENGELFNTGLDVNFYLTGQGSVEYFLGPGLYGGVERDLYFFEDKDRFQNSSQFNVFVKFNNGVLFRPNEMVNITLFSGIGFRYFKDLGAIRHSVKPTHMLSANFGFRF